MIMPNCKNKSGVYKIVNIINNKIYIGSSNNIYERWLSHIECLNNNKHQNKYLQNAWNKYGEVSFRFEVIEYIEKDNKDKLLEREQYWIDICKCFDRKIGYNLSPTAGSPLGTKRTEEEKERKRLKSKTNKPILQIDINGNIIKRWNGVKEICKKLSYQYSAINEAVKHKRGYIPYGYIWIYELEYLEKGLNLEEYIKNSKWNKIIQFDMKHNIVEIWDNLTQIKQETNFDISHISKCCNFKNKKHKGYFWMYKIDYDNNIRLDKNNKRDKQIIQLDLDNNLIKEWDSIRSASLSLTGKLDSSIKDSLSGKQNKSYGYKWMYKEEYEKLIAK